MENFAPRTPPRNALKERTRYVLQRQARVKAGDFVNFHHISNGKIGSGQVLRKVGMQLPKFPGENVWVVNNGAKVWAVPVSRIFAINSNE